MCWYDLDGSLGMENAREIEFWNANAGLKWTQNQQRLDKLFSNVSARLLEISNPINGMSVLDIGCGTGAIALDLASRSSLSSFARWIRRCRRRFETDAFTRARARS